MRAQREAPTWFRDSGPEHARAARTLHFYISPVSNRRGARLQRAVLAPKIETR
jgi:hypothetical protein